jgi:hypothetical protein
MAVDLGRPRAWPNEAARDLRQGGLPGTVRAEQPHQLAPADLETDSAKRLGFAVALGDFASDEGGCH